MTDPTTPPTSTTGPIPAGVNARVLALVTLLLAAFVVIGCSGGEVEDPEADQSNGAEPGSPVGDCETIVTAPEIEYRSTSDLTEQERQLLAVFRGRSGSVLVEQNPVSCQGLTAAPNRIEAEEFGAFEAKSFSHADPEIRYDLLYFTERQPIDATIREDLTTRVSALNGPGTSLRVWAVADTLFLAVTVPADDSDAEAIAGYYNQLIAGEE